MCRGSVISGSLQKLSVLSQGRPSCFFFFPPPVFVFLLFVLECVARHRAALLGSVLITFFYVIMLINCFSVQGSGEGDLRDDGEHFCTKDPSTLLRGTCELIAESEEAQE